MNTQTLNEAIYSAFENYVINAKKPTGEYTPKERKFYVSDMGKCLRMRFLKRHGIEGKYGFETYFNFMFGDFIHNLGYKALEAADMLIATEQRVESDHFVAKYDGRIRFQGKDLMFDFKSTNPYVMKRIVSGSGDNIENIFQVLKGVMLARADEKGISDTAAVVYINKLPSDKIEPTLIKAREYHLNTYKAEIKEDEEKIVDYWLSNKIPPCTCPGWSTQKYNSYWMFCHMEEKEIRIHLDYLKAGNQVISNGFEIEINKGKEAE